jgi:hypothetical protein
VKLNRTEKLKNQLQLKTKVQLSLKVQKSPGDNMTAITISVVSHASASFPSSDNADNPTPSKSASPNSNCEFTSPQLLAQQTPNIVALFDSQDSKGLGNATSLSLPNHWKQPSPRVWQTTAVVA